LGYGGHFAAAGMTLLEENLEAFRNAFEKIVSETIPDELLIPEIVIDAEVSLKDLTMPFFNILSQMEPFGPGNMRPVFIARKLTDSGYSKIVKEQHLRFSVKQNDIHFTGIGFGMADKYTLLQNNQLVDIVFTLDLNEFNGQQNLQMKVIDMKLSE
jgi:single-stranded-DNA-specific exonuclease